MNSAFLCFCLLAIKKHPSACAAHSPSKAGRNWCQWAETCRYRLEWKKNLRFEQGCCKSQVADEKNDRGGVWMKNAHRVSAIKGPDFPAYSDSNR